MKIGKIQKDNYEIQILPNETGEFKFLSIVNGLYTINGGTHIDYILDKVATPIYQKLKRKYKNIKLLNIKNAIKIYINLRFVSNLEFDSQTKERITNNKSHWNEVFKDVNWDRVVNNILKYKPIIDKIIERYEIQRIIENQKLIQKHSKKKSNFSSDKFLKPIGKSNENLFITEGISAGNMLSSAFGRKGNGYYFLKGKPLNTNGLEPKKYLQNIEIKEIITIYNTYRFKKIIIASDRDLDGSHINILNLYNLFKLLDVKELYILLTPIITIYDKKKNIIDVCFSFSDINKYISKYSNGKYIIKYSKGLGSNNTNDMKKIIKKYSFENMILKIEKTNDIMNFLNDWTSNNSDIKKKYILENEFNIVKL